MDKSKKSQKKILIAEDEKLMAKALSDQLERAGFTAKVAFDGESALDLATKEKFDLILLDIVMPKLNGLEVLAKLRSEDNRIPIIVLSNSSKDETIAEAKKLGAAEYFVKSNISLSEIIRAVESVLSA